MDIVEPSMYLQDRFGACYRAFVLTVEIGFDIEFDKRFSPQKQLRSEEFILVKKARREPQVAKCLAPESIAPSRCSKVAALEELTPPPFPMDGCLALPAFLRLFRRRPVRSLEHHHIGPFTPDLLEDGLISRREDVVVGIDELQVFLIPVFRATESPACSCRMKRNPFFPA